MNPFRVFSFRLLGCLALAGAVAAATIGYARARSHIVPATGLAGTPVLVTGDKSLGETYWLLPGLSTEVGLIQFTGSPYRARHTNIYLGSCIASVPLTIPWFLTVAALVFTGGVLVFQRLTYDRAA